MRNITEHQDPKGEGLKIEVTGEVGEGGANHRYVVSGFDTTKNESLGDDRPTTTLTLLFQRGTILTEGNNGITLEVLLAIVADRLKSFQGGAFPSAHNDAALKNTLAALAALKDRTRERRERGVEGKLKP